MANEDTSVYMLVVGRITDKAKIAEYQAALMESGLYPKNEGHYVAFGRPVEMFEGEWPDDQAIVVAKFPSRAHAQAFWNSDEYQQRIKPLREGAGTFNVSVFPAAPSS